MPTERVQRQIDTLLDSADAALLAHDWAAVSRAALSVLNLDPGNEDAAELLAGALREEGRGDRLLVTGDGAPAGTRDSPSAARRARRSAPLPLDVPVDGRPERAVPAESAETSASRHRHRRKASWRRRLSRRTRNIKQVALVALILAVAWAGAFAAALSCSGGGGTTPPPPAAASG